MKATIESTDRVVKLENGAHARVWESVSESGVPFVAYISRVQVKTEIQQDEFERDLQEHKRPEPETIHAIDNRFIW